MTFAKLAAILSLACAFLAPAPAMSADPTPAYRVLSSYPNGHYLENLAVRSNGDVLYTDYFERVIHRWDGRVARDFAKLANHPVNLLMMDGEWIVLTHGAKFTDGPSALKGSNALVHLSGDGKHVRRSIVLPDLVFGNGMALLDASHVLITDSVLGTIWKVDVKTGVAEPWLDSELLKPRANAPLPGANGLRIHAGSVYVSNSATKKLYTVKVDTNHLPDGALTELPTQPSGIDDFAIDRSGVFYIATHGEQVLKFDGRETTMLLDVAAVAGCTSAALSPDGRTIYVLGTGGLYEGKKDAAALVAITLNDTARSPQ